MEVLMVMVVRGWDVGYTGKRKYHFLDIAGSFLVVRVVFFAADLISRPRCEGHLFDY